MTEDEERYIEHIATETYNNLIKERTHTDKNYAWYEEDQSSGRRVDMSAIWLDSDLIPTEPEDYLFEDNILYGEKHTSKIAVLEKFDKAATEHVKSNIIKSEKLIDALQNEKYHITVTDANGNEIPFGLNKMSLDYVAGYISFIDGWPSGYELPFYVSGYRYIGRKAQGNVLTSDGSVKMADDYTPTDDKDIATKEYVDENTGDVKDTVDKLVPPEPDVLSTTELKLICKQMFTATDINTNVSYDHVVLPDYEWTLKTDRIYNPHEGQVDLLLYVNNIWVTLATVYLAEEGKCYTNNANFNIDYDGDAYDYDLTATGFYSAVELSYTNTFNNLQTAYRKYGASLVFCIRVTIGTNNYYTKTVELQIESNQKEDTLEGENAVLSSDDMDYRYVSGIITPRAGCNIQVSSLDYVTLNYFTKKTQIADLFFINNKILDYPDIPYSLYIPALEINHTFEIPDNYYSEKISLEANTYNIFNEQNGHYENEYNFRIDTVSDESRRVTSGTYNSDNKTIDDCGNTWDATEDLRLNNEMQMLGGIYQWPSLDFSINGTGTLTDGTFSNTSWIKSSLDYSQCEQAGVRYVTIKDNIDWTNGVFISFENSTNIIQNKDSFSYNVDSIYIKVAGYTDWLDAKKAYKGLGIVSNWMDGCLAVSESKEGFIYCTFGPKPVKGTIYVRAGFKYEDQQTFTDIKIQRKS